MTGTSKSQDSTLASKSRQHLDEVKAAWLACTRCSLSAGKYQAVLGTGGVPALLAIVCDVPLDGEDRDGIPFTGEAENFLDISLDIVGLTREEVFLTNAMGCRPPDNLTPSQVQMKACRPRLFAELYAADPLVIVSMGQVATSVLFGKWVTMYEVIGKMHPIELPGRYNKWRTTLVPTYGLEQSISQSGLSNNNDMDTTFKHLCMAVDGLRHYQRLRREQWQDDCKRPPRDPQLDGDELSGTSG